MSSPRLHYRGGVEADDFYSALQQLKYHGCTLLVTGEVSRHISGLATRRMLGHPDEKRKRILAFTDATSEYLDFCLPSSVSRGQQDVWIVDPTGEERTIPVTATDIELPAVTSDQSDLNRLRQELVQAISFFDEAANGLGRSELRIGISALDKLLADNTGPAVKRFIRSVNALVRGVNGMGHARIPLPDDHPTVQELSPLFDARVELRKRDVLKPEQRWHLPRHGITTDWAELNG